VEICTVHKPADFVHFFYFLSFPYRWESKNGKIPQRSIVLLRSGWGSRWPDKRLFRGAKNDSKEEQFIGQNDLNFPGFDSTAAQFLAVERNVIGVGIDTLSIDPGNSAVYKE